MSELAERMGRKYKPSPGSIYPAVAALEVEGLIEAEEDGERRVYALTSSGKAALDRRADQLARIESEMNVRLGDDSVEVVLARFAERVRGLRSPVDAGALEEMLNATLTELDEAEGP